MTTRRFPPPGSPGILKVDLSQRKRHSDDETNDEKRGKSPIGLFFVSRFTRPLQVGHRNLPFAFNLPLLFPALSRADDCAPIRAPDRKA
jgi:hypothetical protein